MAQSDGDSATPLPVRTLLEPRWWLEPSASPLTPYLAAWAIEESSELADATSPSARVDALLDLLGVVLIGLALEDSANPGAAALGFHAYDASQRQRARPRLVHMPIIKDVCERIADAHFSFESQTELACVVLKHAASRPTSGLVAAQAIISMVRARNLEKR